MKCHACGRELARKEALYTEDRLSYCNNPLVCNDEHPNSVKNILARQGAARMFTEEDLENNLFENLNVSPEMKDRIMKIATKPQSIRLSKVDIAYYLIQLQDKHQFSSLSESIRHCVHVAMNIEPIDEIPQPAVTVIEPQSVEDSNLQTVPEEVSVVIGSKKVSGADLIKQQIAEKDEEEFTF